MSKNNLTVILFALVTIIFVRQISHTAENPNPKPPQPKPPVVVPNPEPIPKLDTNILYDEYDKSIELAKTHKRKVILIFGADWCPYCVKLKKEVKSIKEFGKYIVCFLNTDNKNNQSLLNKFKPRNLPTSVLIDIKAKEFARKIGYKNREYVSWLKSLP